MTQAMQTDDWSPFDKDDTPLAIGDLVWWSDLNGFETPRMAKVESFDKEEGLIYCRDKANTCHMTVPEELTKQPATLEGTEQ
jgi:hypothetical protein